MLLKKTLTVAALLGTLPPMISS
ncbi:hypothetical protein EMIT0P43_40043 [Pseudomonas jessenii]